MGVSTVVDGKVRVSLVSIAKELEVPVEVTAVPWEVDEKVRVYSRQQ
jgi:hypothetical protein